MRGRPRTREWRGGVWGAFQSCSFFSGHDLSLILLRGPSSLPPTADFKDEEQLVANNTRVLVKKINAKVQIAELNDTSKTCVRLPGMLVGCWFDLDMAFVMKFRLLLSMAQPPWWQRRSRRDNTTRARPLPFPFFCPSSFWPRCSLQSFTCPCQNCGGGRLRDGSLVRRAATPRRQCSTRQQSPGRWRPSDFARTNRPVQPYRDGKPAAPVEIVSSFSKPAEKPQEPVRFFFGKHIFLLLSLLALLAGRFTCSVPKSLFPCRFRDKIF